MRILLLIAALMLAVPTARTAMAVGMESQPEAAPRDPDYENGRKPDNKAEQEQTQLALSKLHSIVLNVSSFGQNQAKVLRRSAASPPDPPPA